MILRISKKTMKWIVLVIVFAFLGAGGLMSWAASSDGGGGVERTAPEASGANLSGVPSAMPVPPPRPVQRAAVDGELVGTAVVEGGTSYAMFQTANGTRIVREGDEIAGGIRLVQVRRNRIDVERNGVKQEVRIGWSEGIGQQVRPGSNPAGSGVEVRARLREHLRATGRL
jgi:hypothetical protein